jgi:acylphosphatase
LEHQWDSSEAKLRKIDGTTWTKIDGTIDIVLAAARSANPDANKSQAALNNSLSVLNTANKSAADTASSTTLVGQLTDFSTIENNMLKDVNSNNFTLAKKSADDLEHQWDTSEPKLRKIDGTTWTNIDGTIDVVLAAVRSSSPDVSKSKSALTKSLSIINGVNK